MIRSVTFPLRTESENAYRGVAFVIASLPKKRQMGAAHGIDRKRARQRETVRLVLKSQFTRPQLALYERVDGWRQNRFTVTITRIAVGTFDHSNLVGGLKHVEDEVAAFLGLDDRSDRITWRRLQQRCAGGRTVLAASGKRVRVPAYQGLRIEVVDLDVGADQVRLVGPAPTLIGEAEEQPQRGRPGVTAGRAKRVPKGGSLADFEASFGSGAAVWAKPEGQRFLREMRGGLDDQKKDAAERKAAKGATWDPVNAALRGAGARR